MGFKTFAKERIIDYKVCLLSIIQRLDADRDLWTVALEERDRNTEDREKSGYAG